MISLISCINLGLEVHVGVPKFRSCKTLSESGILRFLGTYLSKRIHLVKG